MKKIMNFETKIVDRYVILLYKVILVKLSYRQFFTGIDMHFHSYVLQTTL